MNLWNPLIPLWCILINYLLSYLICSLVFEHLKGKIDRWIDSHRRCVLSQIDPKAIFSLLILVSVVIEEGCIVLTLPMLRQLSSKAQECKDFRKPSKPCHVVYLDTSHRVLSDEYPYTRVSVTFSGFLHHFVLAKLATSSIMVNKSTLPSPRLPPSTPPPPPSPGQSQPIASGYLNPALTKSTLPSSYLPLSTPPPPLYPRSISADS